MLKGKHLSILGDSISTYYGVSNDPSANPTLRLNHTYYSDEHFPREMTYWQIIIDSLGLELCVNNSYSGGLLSGINDPHSGVNRARELSRTDGTDPDIIIIFMGINDLGWDVNISVFSADYEKTLSIIKEKYPDATVCCVNIPNRTCIPKEQTEQYNSAISNAVKLAGDGFFIADLFNSRLNGKCYYENSIDSLHPDGNGMRILSEIITDAIKQHIN